MINVADDVKAVESACEADSAIGICMVKENEKKKEGETAPSAIKMSDLHRVGTMARVIRKINLPDGGLNVFVSTMSRFRIKRRAPKTPFLTAYIEYLDDTEADTFDVKALSRTLMSEMKEIAENSPMFSEEMRLNMANIDEAGRAADFITSVLGIDKDEQQGILETINVRERLEKVLIFVKREQEVLKVQKKIQKELNEKIEKNQRAYFLREEMKSIQEELGTDADGKETDAKRFRRKIDEFHFEGELKEAVESELEKFNMMDPNSAEWIGTRSYLDLVTALPWLDEGTEDFTLAAAKKILERDHYGLDDVKKRIMEFLSVRRLKVTEGKEEELKGSILLLVGPPGVGKTSIGRSVARAMNKPFYRFSVGGLRDEAEIKGHRRTYIGALPGRIIQGLKTTKTRSPVFMIDEVDKMGESIEGDPASALLEVLDAEQNVSFRDNYLDLPFDISRVFFILTANTTDSIPPPLLDRAEVITLPGYIDQEKVEIAKRHLIPKNLEKNALAKGAVKYTKEALLRIAEEYAREAGVRNYDKCVDKIHRKIVARIMMERETGGAEQGGAPVTVTADSDGGVEAQAAGSAVSPVSITVDAQDLDEYLGKPVFDESMAKKADKSGTAIGLAWTNMGGDTLLIESVAYPSEKGSLLITGQLGDVMKESAQIAFTYVKKTVLEKGIKDKDWFECHTVHLHVPEGATKKDGPSAGVTMATALMSLMSGEVIRRRLAMTGEISLTGLVLPIGGLREKTVAAKRLGIKTILIPKGNLRDTEDIPRRVKSGISFVSVESVEDVFNAAFLSREKD